MRITAQDAYDELLDTIHEWTGIDRDELDDRLLEMLEDEWPGVRKEIIG